MMEVSVVLALVEPVFREMLTDAELQTVRVHVAPLEDAWDRPLDSAEWWAQTLKPDDLVETNSATVHWSICGEQGASGGLWLDDGPEQLVRHVQSALQDFIAESSFAWGELRGPRDLP